MSESDEEDIVVIASDNEEGEEEAQQQQQQQQVARQQATSLFAKAQQDERQQQAEEEGKRRRKGGPVTASIDALNAEADEKKTCDTMTWELIDYDHMSFADFVTLLSTKTPLQRSNERRQHLNARRKDEPDVKEVIEHFTDNAGGYSYKRLLERAFDQLKADNPDMDKTGDRDQVPMPLIEKQGSKKTVLKNFAELCGAIHREMDDVKDYIEKNLTTHSSIDQNNCLIIKITNVKQQQVESLFSQYIAQYVRCNMCHRIDTVVKKDAASRLLTLHCNKCHAERSVQATNTATYQASTVKRSKLRNRVL